MADHHHHIDAVGGDRRMGWAVAVNVVLTVAQLVGGVLSGSLALIADALHNFSDVISLLIAFAARRIARRNADARMTFGYARVEVVAASVNYTTLILVGLYLVYEALLRLLDPSPVEGNVVVWLALVALAVNGATAFLTYALSRESLNIRAAFLHNLADALGSLAVLVAGLLIVLFGWTLADPLITLAIAAYILVQSFREIGPVIRILVLGAPPDIDTGKVLAAIAEVAGVCGVHRAHIWQYDEHESALDAHLVVEDAAWERTESVKQEVRDRLARDFGIAHSTLELERSGQGCEAASTYGEL